MRNSGATSAQAGFVLLELLAVMLILALAITAGATALSHRRPSATPSQMAERIQAGMLQARAEAMRTGTDIAVTIDLASRRVLYLPGATPLAVPETMHVRLRTGAELASGQRAQLVFRPDGSSSGGELWFEQAGREAGLEVNWMTGLPRVQSGARQ
jgi:general secretion pathway protein H